MALSSPIWLSYLRKWGDPEAECPSHVVQMIRDSCTCAQHFGDSYLVADRYFLSVDALKKHCRRFRIETSFRELKQQVGRMAYHFWTGAMPLLSHYRKKADPDPLGAVTEEHDREKIRKAVRATEMYALMSCISMGIIQILSVGDECRIPTGAFRYQRTPAKAKPSEANIMEYLRHNLFRFMCSQPENGITQIIRGLQTDPDDTENAKTA